MFSYLLRRLLYTPLIIFGVMLVTFFLFFVMQKPETTAKQPNAQTGELSDTALNQAAGGMLAWMPTDQLVAHSTGGGGGAGQPAPADGSVKTNSILIGL